MNLNNRVLRLEQIWQNRLNLDEHDESAEHDRITGDNLLRIWEGGADDWVRERVEQVIEKCEGLSPACASQPSGEIEDLANRQSRRNLACDCRPRPRRARLVL